MCVCHLEIWGRSQDKFEKWGDGFEIGGGKKWGNDTNASRKDEEDPLDGSLEIIWVGWGCDTVEIRDGALVEFSGLFHFQ